MNADREDVVTALKFMSNVQVAKKQPPSKSSQSIIRQASVNARWLVNDSKWDTYLTWIQADKEELESMAASARVVLEDPAVMDHNSLLKAKTVLLESKAMIKALDIAISYPTQILVGKKDLEEREKDLHNSEN